MSDVYERLATVGGFWAANVLGWVDMEMRGVQPTFPAHPMQCQFRMLEGDAFKEARLAVADAARGYLGPLKDPVQLQAKVAALGGNWKLFAMGLSEPFQIAGDAYYTVWGIPKPEPKAAGTFGELLSRAKVHGGTGTMLRFCVAVQDIAEPGSTPEKPVWEAALDDLEDGAVLFAEMGRTGEEALRNLVEVMDIAAQEKADGITRP